MAAPVPLSIGVPVAFCQEHSYKSRDHTEEWRRPGAARASCVVLDKTGTLTTGELKITGSDIVVLDVEGKACNTRFRSKSSDHSRVSVCS